eukprot:3702137-Ditylum_brightwellii.AAC.1
MVLISKIQQWCGDDTTPPGIPTDPLGVLLTEAVPEQNDLGWENLMKGRILKKWGMAQQQHSNLFTSRSPNPDTARWDKELIRLLWN